MTYALRILSGASAELDPWRTSTEVQLTKVSFSIWTTDSFQGIAIADETNLEGS